MSWITVGVSAGSALLGASSAKKAAKAREAAYQAAGGTVTNAYTQARGELDQRSQQEQAAISRQNTLLGLPGGDGSDPTAALRATPGYQWQMDQGTQAVQRSAAARGGLASGNTLIALNEYGQGLADQTFQQYLNNIGGVAQQGVDSQLASYDVNEGNSLANLQLGAGGARASGIEDSTNALIGGASSVGSLFANRGGQQSVPAYGLPPGGGVMAPQPNPTPGTGYYQPWAGVPYQSPQPYYGYRP